MHGLSCPTSRGIFPDQGLNPCLLHWQGYLYPMDHQGTPAQPVYKSVSTILSSLYAQHLIHKSTPAFCLNLVSVFVM